MIVSMVCDICGEPATYNNPADCGFDLCERHYLEHEIKELQYWIDKDQLWIDKNPMIKKIERLRSELEKLTSTEPST